MRLFVAVEIDQAVLGEAAATLAELRQRTARLAPRARVTWSSPDRLHLTLVFIGERDGSSTEAVMTALRPPIGLEAFDAEVAGLGAFPARGAPRVIWAGIAAGADRMVELQARVAACLAAAGVPPEARVYRPHLTLARVRDPAGLGVQALLEGVDRTRLGRTRVQEITLFESRLSPKGPTYLVLHRAALGARSTHG